MKNRDSLIKLTNVPIIDMAINNFLDAYLQAKEAHEAGLNTTGLGWDLSHHHTMLNKSSAECKDAKKLLKTIRDGYVKNGNPCKNELACTEVLTSMQRLMSDIGRFKSALARKGKAFIKEQKNAPTGLAGFTFAEAS